MSRVISQETFDEVVKENIDEFSMIPEEAIEDAIEQFKAQGVDLSNIVKELAMSDNSDITTIVNKIKSFTPSTPKTEIKKELGQLKLICEKGVRQKVAAGKVGAYAAILQLMTTHENDEEILAECLSTMVSLMAGQPDLLNADGIQFMMRSLETQTNKNIQCLFLQWIRECCVKHENNRQQIFEAAILDHLKILLNNESAQLLRHVCGVLRSLVLDDDVRHEFGKAHEHARIIAGNTLKTIIQLLQKYKNDEELINDLLLTISAIVVRNEFCTDVEDAGGLDFVLNALNDFMHNQKIIRHCLRLLKVLAGNDVCKAHIIQKGGAPIITNALKQSSENPQTAPVGLTCIAAMTLRSPENSKALFEAGVANVIVIIMKMYPDVMDIQKAGCWAIRNMVSRSRYQNQTFLQLDVEIILLENLKKFPDCEYDIKSALRDLDCRVEFKEEWTGKGGQLSTGVSIPEQ